MSSHPTPAGAVLERLRLLLLLLVTFGATGLVAELLLIGHYEEWTQWSPLVVLGAMLVLATRLALRPSPGALRAFRTLALVGIVAGVVGSVLHYRANAELELEVAPDRPARVIAWAALGGGVPTLAPGAMIHLGLLGLLAVFRHPAGRD